MCSGNTKNEAKRVTRDKKKKNTVTEIKNAFDRLIIRLDKASESISNFENINR